MLIQPPLGPKKKQSDTLFVDKVLTLLWHLESFFPNLFPLDLVRIMGPM